MKKWTIIEVSILCIVLGLVSGTVAQTTAGDSSANQTARIDSTDRATGEMILDEIEIRGKVEKPGVIVMPKRIEPELGEVELTRSFKKEMKQGVGEIPKPEKELGSVDRVKSIKKTVKRKRK